MVILAFLQNAYFKNPNRVKLLLEKNPDMRRDFLKRTLFMGCRTGRNLQKFLGEDYCKRIIWEETTKEIAGDTKTVFKPDFQHIGDTITEIRPDLIICFGKVAKNALINYIVDFNNGRNDWPIFYASHPTNRDWDEMAASLIGLREYLDKFEPVII